VVSGLEFLLIGTILFAGGLYLADWAMSRIFEEEQEIELSEPPTHVRTIQRPYDWERDSATRWNPGTRQGYPGSGVGWAHHPETSQTTNHRRIQPWQTRIRTW
jgi:hypothetical protein